MRYSFIQPIHLNSYMKTKIFLIVLIVTFLIPTSTFAEKRSWKNKISFSFVKTGGNTDVTRLSAKNQLKYYFSKKFQGSLKVGAFFAESNGKKNAERYFTDLRADYKFTKKFFLAAIVGWKQDEFSGIESRYSQGPALGYHFLKGPVHSLVSETGLHYVNEDLTDGTDDDYLGVRLFAKYQYAFLKKNKFSQVFEYINDFENKDNYNLNSETALIYRISRLVSQKTSYVVKHDNKPVPSTFKKTDTTLSVSFVVNF